MTKFEADLFIYKSRKASFLGDANFPRSAEKYVKGMRIELLQHLYERYSRLSLSVPSDRPIAIKGLETRLLDTFDTTGGYGVFDKYLHRCLLWQRSGDTLRRLESFRGNGPVPSWSWMAYHGHIHYSAVPFGQASWSSDIQSPFIKFSQVNTLGNGHQEGEDIAAQVPELEAPVWDLVDTRDGQMVLDEPRRTLSYPIQCIIVGKSKGKSLSEQRTYYVLLVHFIADIDGAKAYERVGVGFLERRHISLQGPLRKARVR